MLKIRYLERLIAQDLKEKMVFIGGPRQVGKTTLARQIGKKYKHPLYLNWDSREDRAQIIKFSFPANTDLVIFDELHKYKQWKNFLKGIFDKYQKQFHILVTGSARLDLYRRGGDSLFGRHHYYRLHPFSMAELSRTVYHQEMLGQLSFKDNSKEIQANFDKLTKFGGFPEPMIRKNDRTLRRWQNERLEKLIQQDIRGIELIRDLSSLEILSAILPDKVGSLFSLNALREDLQVAHKTIAGWVDILERFYYHFRIYPFKSTTIKSLRKEPKLYLWDWSQIQSTAVKLENIMASHLLKFIQFLYDSQGYKAELYFLRDREGREVDFLVTIDKQPWFAVEVKNKDRNISKNLLYFAKRLKIPYLFQVVSSPGIDLIQDQVRVISADKFLSALV